MQEMSSFRFPTSPVARPEACVVVENARFTILTSRMVRIEYSPTQKFEDHASQAFWFRDQPIPPFKVSQAGGQTVIETDHLRLFYTPMPDGFTRKGLYVELKESENSWHFGDHDWRGNLHGTGRTLDGADGAIRLEMGLMSRTGWSLVDDSKTLVFNSDGWLEPRRIPDALDLYFFGYGHNYLDCLKEYTRITGHTPLIPRWILGNWWSRYWPYRQQDVVDLIQDFRAHEVPLAICIIDMDWHITQTGNESSGWTGYTWNKELFPDPAALTAWLHSQGLRTALNLHPAEGVHPHEIQYPQMAAHLGIDPASQDPIPFDCTDPRFMRGYFDILHHPYEEMGVDFWWLDWQQGSNARIPNLDPLWWLNHLHFRDSGRDISKRSFIFSRWGGLGNHRYPIGFSGDSVVSWASLAFQPFFTATAANVGYGWWSHDIGGHMGGNEDRELYTRWVQFGVFSPITRLHSTFNAYQERRPWGFDAEVLRIAKGVFQLRHALIPYIYTMAWRNTTQDIPLVTPMYFAIGDANGDANPEDESAYMCPDQYNFGSELVAAPFLTPSNPDTRLSRGSVWLPAGDWFNFFTGEHFTGGWHPLYGTLEDIPVFAKAGAIVPLSSRVGWGGLDNPSELTLNLFPGADNCFDLYEDDGVSNEYQHGHSAITAMAQTWNENELRFAITPVKGDLTIVPAERRYTLVWRGIRQPETVEAWVDGAPVPVSFQYDLAVETLTLAPLELQPAIRLEVHLGVAEGSLLSGRDRTLENWKKALHAFRCDPNVKSELEKRFEMFRQDASLLGAAQRHLNEAQIAVLLQTLHK